MPRTVRNFWIDLNIPGRTPIGAGPKAKDAGFRAVVYIRENASVAEGLVITGDIVTKEDGLRYTRLWVTDGISGKTNLVAERRADAEK